MPKLNALSDRQLVLLSHASQRHDLLLVRPDNVRGGAAKALVSKLLSGGLVEEVAIGPGEPVWRADQEGPIGLKVTPAGLQAIGFEPEAVEASTSALEAAPGETPETLVPDRPSAGKRVGTKRTLVLALLSRAQGASLGEITAATGWLPHTARAALTGLRQSGHAIRRSRDADNRSVYRRIVADAAGGGVAIQWTRV